MIPDDEIAGGEAARLLALQRAAQRREGPPSKAVRRDRLKRLGDLVRDNLAAIARAISADFGQRSAVETELLEASTLLAAIAHARRDVGVWMRPKPRPADLTFWPGRAQLRYEPLGVIGIVAPWNYPLLLLLSPLTGALAAGNRAVLKPAHNLPTYEALIGQLFRERFDEAEVAVVANGPGVSEAFTRLPFDHLVFTGSTATGRKVMAGAAENLTPLTLELGGKSPALICASADRAKAVEAIAYGKFVNAGQTCIAPDYVLAPADEVETLGEGIIAAARRAYPDLGRDYTSIIDAAAFDRLSATLAEARAGGALVLDHGRAPDAARRLLAPAVVIGPPADSALLKGEIFGPILPVVPYRTLDEALAFIAARPHPLALYVFAEDGVEVAHVLDRSQSGGVTVNGVLLHIAQDALPFGGIGESGMGRYHGVEGFRQMSHARSVFHTGPISPLSFFAPPYDRTTRFLVRQLLRRG